jgi:hypothetical protein
LKERVISAAVGLLMAGMAVMFGTGAYVSHGDHLRELDYQSWVNSPGRLRMLELSQTLHRMRWQYVVSCEYEFEFGGVRHIARRFDLKGVIYPTLGEAKASVEAQFGIAGRAQWRQVRHQSADDWALDTDDIAVTVRHSPRDPSSATLTATPPMSTWLNWVIILVLGALALVTGLGSVTMAVISCLPQGVGPWNTDRSPG